MSRFSASTDFEVRKRVLDCDLHILPILMKFEPHVRAEFPLESPDSDATAKWIDDRIVDFVVRNRRANFAEHRVFEECAEFVSMNYSQNNVSLNAVAAEFPRLEPDAIAYRLIDWNHYEPRKVN